MTASRRIPSAITVHKGQRRWVVLCTFFLLALLIDTCTSSKSSFYDTLGIDRSCSSEQIKKAYLKKCLKHHPDKGGDEEQFKEISKAYEVLSDKEKRQLYDQYGEAGIDPNSGAQSWSSMFGQKAGGGTRQHFYNAQQQQRSQHVDLEELFREMMGGQGGGAAFGGNGGTNMFGSNMFGSNMFGQSGFNGNTSPFADPFGGRVETFNKDLPCSIEDLFAGKTKKLKVNVRGQSKIYTIKLKPGWKAGTKVTYKATPQWPYNVIFTVKEKPHDMYERKGDDLYVKQNLSKLLKQKGDLVTIELILPDGQLWKRKVPRKSSFLKPRRQLTIQNHGMPIKGGPLRGNLIIEFY